MGARIPVKEILDTFKETYRAIDIRSAVVRENDRWVNAFSIIRLSHEQPHKLRKRIREVTALHQPVNSELFRILGKVHPITELDRVCSDLRAGHIVIGDMEIGIASSLDIYVETYLETYYRDVDVFDGYEWPIALISAHRAENRRLNNNVVVREAQRQGYSNAYIPVSHFCQARLWDETYDNELYVVIPLFSMVSAVRIKRNPNAAEVTINRHRNSPSMEAVASFFRIDSDKGRIPLGHNRSTSLPEPKGRAVIQDHVMTIPTPDLHDDDEVEITLIHSEMGEVHKHRERARRYLSPEDSNPLHEALKLFCSSAELEKLLTSPHEAQGPDEKKKKKPLDPAAAFEVRVTWILSLFGFSTILLSDHEVLRPPGMKYEQGSVDILAYSKEQGMFLTVACTTAALHERDFNNLSNMRGTLQDEVLHSASLAVLPIIFTAAKEQPLVKETQPGVPNIAILGHQAMPKLLELLAERQEEIFYNFLRRPEDQQANMYFL